MSIASGVLAPQELEPLGFSKKYIDGLMGRDPSFVLSDFDIEALSSEVIVVRNVLARTIATDIVQGLADAKGGVLDKVATGSGQSFARYDKRFPLEVADTLVQTHQSIVGKEAVLIARRYEEGGYQAPHLDTKKSQISVLLSTGGGATRVDIEPTSQRDYSVMTFGGEESLDYTYWLGRDFLDVQIGDHDIAFVPGSTVIHGGVAEHLSGDHRDLVAINSL